MMLDNHDNEHHPKNKSNIMNKYRLNFDNVNQDHLDTNYLAHKNRYMFVDIDKSNHPNNELQNQN